jgi:uncharacterized protein
LIVREEEEAALPGGYEPLLTQDGQLNLADVIEDELILALPVVPLSPAAEQQPRVWGEENETQDDEQPNPFAVLKKMKVENR